MKLEPIAKPVRIRITSNGKEHADLASLRENFCIDDVFKSYTEKGLEKWLRQIKEDDLASLIKEIDTKARDEFERKFLLCLLMFAPSRYEDGLEHICSNVDEVQMCSLLSRINADDVLQDYSERVNTEALEKLIESEDPKIKIVTKIELGERNYKKAQETGPGENQINLYKRAIELGHPSAYEKCLRALNVSESVVNEINNNGNGITLQDIDFIERLKKVKCSEDVKTDKLSNELIKEIAEYVYRIFYTIEEIKKASHSPTIYISALDKFDPENKLLKDVVMSSINLLTQLPWWLSYPSEEEIDYFKHQFDSTCSRYVSRAFLDKHKEVIENGKYSRYDVCEMLRDLAYYFVFTK